MSEVRAALPALHVVTDDAVLAREDLTTVARRLIASLGARMALHLRGPDTGVRTLLRLAETLAPVAADAGALLVVNDRVDVALAVGGGVHLGERSLPLTSARALMGAHASVGASTHDPEAAARAAREGASWVFAGTVWPTPGHPDAEPCGTRGLSAAVAAAGAVPVLAIGGVTPERGTVAREAGAYGVAVIRGVWAASDPIGAAVRYLEAMERAPGAAGGGSR